MTARAVAGDARGLASAIAAESPQPPAGQPVLVVSDLSVEYILERAVIRAVDGVSLQVAAGEFLAIVGESGCGKSTLLFAIAQLLFPPAAITGGSVTFLGRDMVGLGADQLAAIRWKEMSVVMQSAMNALNPVLSVGAQFRDVMHAHGVTSKDEIADRSARALRLVGIDPVHLRSYPHQLSGGMRQRSMIAMALLFRPKLVMMDEPTSALDVVAQRSLMAQITELRQEFGFAVIFVTHDMSLVSHFSGQLMVMYAGQVSEVGRTGTVFRAPRHPYTVGLMDAFPSISGPRVRLTGIPGSPPDLARPLSGCRFAPRCPQVMPRCEDSEPPLYRLPEADVRCFLFEDGDPR